jgi:ribosome maturation factor RimP
MNVAHEQLHGLDRERLLAVVEPVLRAHRVEGVELLWRTDRSGWVLELTIERPDSQAPGAGISIELCSQISRDLSQALDVADIIEQRYSLQVGSPGLDRALYSLSDYKRFAGQQAKLKLREPYEGQHVIRGFLRGLDDDGLRLVIETNRGLLSFQLDEIDSARLVFDWNDGGRRDRGPRPRRAANRGKSTRGSRRSR